LNGDFNLLHIDPRVAKAGNFEVPILHGLCTYGFSARAVYDRYCNNNPKIIKRIGGRFTSHVFPGETLVIEMWKDGNIIYYETKTKERGLVVMKGLIELEDT
jgi:acyl dehydratase